MELLAKISEVIVLHCIEMQESKGKEPQTLENEKQQAPVIEDKGTGNNPVNQKILAEQAGVSLNENNKDLKEAPLPATKNKGKLLVDATVPLKILPSPPI